MIIEINRHWLNNKMLITNPSGGGGEPKTPLQLASKGEDIENKYKNVMGQTIESLLNHDIKRNTGHHHISMIASTRISEDY